MKKIAIVSAFLILYVCCVFGQAKPFPQNVNYANGYKTTVIPTNVVLNAYTRWKNSFLKSSNGLYRVSVDDTTRTISEGMGYGMVLTAYFGEKKYFDGLLAFYKSKRTAEAYNLMGWNVTQDGIIDPGSATDGDLDVAFSLLIAYCQWGGNYLDEAKNIISILKQNYFVTCSGVTTMKPGGQFGGCGLTDLSYYTPAYFRMFGQVTNDPFWNTVAEDTYEIFSNSANSATGLVPDWESYDGVPGGNPNSGRANYYRYDASRIPWRMSLDYLWNGNAYAHYWCTKISDFANSLGANNIVDGYDLNGAPRGQYNNSPFVGGFAVGAMCNSQSIVNSFAQRLYTLDGTGYDNQYFNLSLRCLYMLVLTGNFWKPDGATTGVEKTGFAPKNFNLFDSFPNPFNPSTTIRYALSKSTQVKLTIYNVLGQKIRTLQNAFQNAGEYSLTWNATDENNIAISSGIYFYCVEEDGQLFQKKMVLIR
jgi:endo-1,4-beta-D-glucanase Y